jgi:hypothetical protein
MEVMGAFAIGVAIALVLVWLSARAAITICVARVRDGKLEITRGWIAPRVLADMRDVVKKPRVKSATVRVVRAKGRARVEARGDLTDAQVQRLRNVIGIRALAELTNR